MEQNSDGAISKVIDCLWVHMFVGDIVVCFFTTTFMMALMPIKPSAQLVPS
jgi:hypothetical protein